MADVLAGFLSGAKAGQAANKARAKAKADAEFKQRAQTNTIRGAGEDQMARLEVMLNDPNWESANTTRALSMASAIDKNYGGLLGRSAVDYVKQTLNLGVTQNKDSHGNRIYSTGEDGTSTAPELRSANAGYTGTTQKLEAGMKRRVAQTSAMAGQIKADGMKFLEQHAYTDGRLDPAKAGMALIKFGAQLEAQPGMDQETVQAVMDNFEDEITQYLEDQAGLMGEKEDRDNYINGVSVKATKMVRDIYAEEFGVGKEITKMMEGTSAIVGQMTDVVNRKAALGWNVPQIMIHLRTRFIDENGEWPTGVKANQFDAAMAESTPEFFSAVASFYSQPENDNGQWEPIYNANSRSGVMYNNETKEMKLLVGPNSPAPSPVAEEPPKAEDPIIGAGAGIGVDGIKELAREKASDSSKSYSESVEKVTGRKAQEFEKADMGIVGRAISGKMGSKARGPLHPGSSNRSK